MRFKSEEALAAELRPISYNNCSVKRAEKIQELVRMDGQTTREYQVSRDAITCSIAGEQALICIARRLVNIVHGMLKNHTEYRKLG